MKFLYSRSNQKHLTVDMFHIYRRVSLFCSLIFLFFITAAPTVAQEKTKNNWSEGKDQELFFFGANSNDELQNSLLSSAFSTQTSGIEESDKKQDTLWGESDPSSHFPELQILDEVSSKRSIERVKQAHSLYLTSVQVLKQCDEKIRKIESEPLSSRTLKEWEEIDMRESRDRQVRSIRSKARQDALTYLVKAMQNIDTVRNPTIRESDHTLDLKSQIYRNYIRLQFQQKNPINCIDVLDKYIRIRKANADESEPYRLIAVAYRQQELAAKKAGNLTASKKYKKIKNQNLMTFAKLAYGTNSPEYARITYQINQDMIEVVD